ncbi:MAG: glycosyltransferase family 4 protein [Candidatus Bathyarchaeia archaeon]
MKIAVVYDFSSHNGGGDLVMLSILETLKNAGHQLTLVTSNPNGLTAVNAFFGKNVDCHNIQFIKLPPFLPHPYTIAYMAKKIKEKSFDGYVFSDDVPKCLWNKKVICYIHYSHAARLKFTFYLTNKYRERISGRILCYIHRSIFEIFYPTVRIPTRNWLLIANSFTTQKHTAQTFSLAPDQIRLVYPPVASTKINTLLKNEKVEKRNNVVCLGRFEPDKGFDNVIRSLSILRNKFEVTLILMGFAYDQAFLENLRNYIKTLRLENRVILRVNAERNEVIDNLLTAKALVHPAKNEPFGLSVVEAMAAGCVPIVSRGLNGPWNEIIQNGKYGLGYATPVELASMIQRVVEKYDFYNINAITQRSLDFDEKVFKEKMLKIFQKFLE